MADCGDVPLLVGILRANEGGKLGLGTRCRPGPSNGLDGREGRLLSDGIPSMGVVWGDATAGERGAMRPSDVSRRRRRKMDLKSEDRARVCICPDGVVGVAGVPVERLTPCLWRFQWAGLTRKGRQRIVVRTET